MANPFLTPTRYEYKPVDMSILAQPMAAMQQQYDAQIKALDALNYDISNLSPDDDRVKKIEAALGEDVKTLTSKLEQTKDFRTSARKLAQLNKFYNSDEEIQAITSNYNAVQEAIKRERKRVEKGHISTEQYDQWYSRMLGEFKAKKGTSYNEGKYNTVNTTGRLKDKDKEIQKLALKLSKEAPEQRKVILGQIGALDEYTNQIIDKTWHYKDKNQVANEIYQALKSSTEYKDWTEEMADYSHYFASQDPDFAANQYGKYMASYDKAIEKVSNSKLKKKEKENAIAELEKERTALQTAYEEDKDGKMKSMYMQQHMENYFQDMASTAADVFDIEPYADIKRTTFQNYEARQAAEANKKFEDGFLNATMLTSAPTVNPASLTDEGKKLNTKLTEGKLITGLAEIQQNELTALDEKAAKSMEMQAAIDKMVTEGADPKDIEQAKIELNTYNQALHQEYISNAKNTEKLAKMVQLGIKNLSGTDSKLKAELIKSQYTPYKGGGYSMSFDPSTGMYTVNEWNETEGGGKLKLSRLSAVAVQRQLQILEDYSKNKIRAEELASSNVTVDAYTRNSLAFSKEKEEAMNKQIRLIANEFKDNLRNVEGISTTNDAMITFEDIQKIYEQNIEAESGYTISDGDMASLTTLYDEYIRAGAGSTDLTEQEEGGLEDYEDVKAKFLSDYADYLIFENGAKKMYEDASKINPNINQRVVFADEHINELTKRNKNDIGALTTAQNLTDLMQRMPIVGTYRLNRDGQYEPINIDKANQPNLQNYTLSGLTKRNQANSTVLVYTPTDYKTDKEVAQLYYKQYKSRFEYNEEEETQWQNVSDASIQNYRRRMNMPDQIYVALKQTDLDVGDKVLEGNKEQTDYFFENGKMEDGLLSLKQQASLLSALGPLRSDGVTQAERYNLDIQEIKTGARDHLTETRTFQMPGADGIMHTITNRIRYTRDPSGKKDMFNKPLIVYTVTQSVDGSPFRGNRYTGESLPKNKYLIELGDVDQGMFFNNLMFIDGGDGELPYDFNID